MEMWSTAFKIDSKGMQTQKPATTNLSASTLVEGNQSARVAAILVLYQPNPELLDRLLQSLASQVQRLFVIDNSAQLSPDLSSHFHSVTNASYKALGANAGIAAAQNIGIQHAFDEGYSHVLLLDQDSALPPRMVDDLLAAERQLLQSGEQVGAVGPVFRDEKTGELSPAIRHLGVRVRKIKITPSQSVPVQADYLISSGSLIRTSVLRQVGTMRDELFIDWVDIEWGLRARRQGLQCFLIPGVIMTHSIGDASVRLLAKRINLHNEVRNYYIVRNATYLLRLPTMGWSWRVITFFKIPQYVVFYSWHSANRWKSVALLLRAVMDGLLGRLGPLR